MKISRRKTDLLGCNEHQDAQIQVEGETVKRVKTFTYLGSTLAEDAELNAEVTHRVQSGWNNWKRVSGVLCNRGMNVKIKGSCTEEGTGKEIGGRRNENATMDVRSYEAGQDQK